MVEVKANRYIKKILLQFNLEYFRGDATIIVTIGAGDIGGEYHQLKAINETI
jgi:hypothetical protein